MTTRILVVSDTHGRRDSLQRCIDTSAPFDIIIHCGDGIKDVRAADIPGNPVVLAVAGNTDIYSSPEEDTILIENIEERIVIITHGHLFNVKSGLNSLVKYAGDVKADVVLFGHTHTGYLNSGIPVLFNPGDLSTGNYGFITIKDNNEWIFEQKSINE